MSGRVGVEITPRSLRVVRVGALSSRVTRAEEVAWDPGRPADGVAAARAVLGRVDSLSVAIGLGCLEVTRVSLPPVPPDEQVRIVELAPDRYFAAADGESFTASLSAGGQVAFGVPAAALEAWLAALESLGPVERVEPAPVALARILPDGAWRLEAAPGEHGLLRVERGEIAEVRRSAMDAMDARPLPPPGGVAVAFTAALAVVRRAPAPRTPPLAPADWRRRLAARRRQRILAAGLAATAAVALAGWSVDRWRERTLAALDDRLTTITEAAGPAEEALRQLRSRHAEEDAMAAIRQRRPDPLAALAAAGAALPRDVIVLSARANGAHWQLDGTASDASTLVPLLDRHPAFDSVRALGATSRYRDANRSYETFSLAFRHRPQP